MKPSFAAYSGAEKIFEYVMVDHQMCYKSNGNYVEFVFMLQRNYLSFVMTSFTPTVMAFLIAYSTNFFPQDSFDAAIGVNLTLLLVLTTM